jgi:hypothetical protein
MCGITDKVRLLYDRSQPTARIVVRNKDDLEVPLVSLVACSASRHMLTVALVKNMTHCYLRAMSPIHIKCNIQSSDTIKILTMNRSR